MNNPTNPTTLLAAYPKDRKTSQWDYRPIEVDEQGRVKVVVPGGVDRLGSGLLAGSNATVFTATKRYRNVQIVIANIDTSDRTIAIYHVPVGSSAADSNALGKNWVLPTGYGPYSLDNLGLAVGDTIQGSCDSANKVAITIYGEICK